MGRITVFSGEDTHSTRVLAALESRMLPFTEVSVVAHPKKIDEIFAYSSRNSVPQVFFNTRFIGGAEETIKELKQWDKVNSKYSTPLQRFQHEIAERHDPNNPALRVPDESPAIKEPVAKVEALSVSLPDDTMTTVWDITEKLKNSLPLSTIKRNKVVYRKSVTGLAAAKVFKVCLGLSETDATAFGQHLLNAKVLVPFTDEKMFLASDKEIYRLQCFVRPDILNYYRIWRDPASTPGPQLLDYLDDMLHAIEMDSMDKHGKLDLLAARNHSNFVRFEDAVCELQSIGLRRMQRKTRLAFGLNVYNLMMRYAFIKIGIARNETARGSYVNNVLFDVGNIKYSFEEWFVRILRPSSVEQSRQRSWFGLDAIADGTNAAPNVDRKIFFAMNIGPLLGSTVSPPFRKYTAFDLDRQLDMAASVFFEDDSNCSVNMRTRTVTLSKVLNWYRADFAKKDANLLDQLLPFLLGAKKTNVEQLLARGSAKVNFVDPDYTRNVRNYSDYNEEEVTSEVKGFRALLRRFKPPTKGTKQALRMETIRKLDILDTLPKERFDRIARMIKTTFQVPVVFVSLVNEKRLFPKSPGWTCMQAPPEVLKCGHSLLQPTSQIMWIEDAAQDERFAESSLVTGPLGMRFYAGCNLSVPSTNGEFVNIGTLCILDHVPRDINDKDLMALKAYAAQVKAEFLRMETEHPVVVESAPNSVNTAFVSPQRLIKQ